MEDVVFCGLVCVGGADAAEKTRWKVSDTPTTPWRWRCSATSRSFWQPFNVRLPVRPLARAEPLLVIRVDAGLRHLLLSGEPDEALDIPIHADDRRPRDGEPHLWARSRVREKHRAPVPATSSAVEAGRSMVKDGTGYKNGYHRSRGALLLGRMQVDYYLGKLLDRGQDFSCVKSFVARYPPRPVTRTARTTSEEAC